jgi:hypothetical protein
VAAAARGDQAAARALGRALERLARSADWTDLVAAIRRLLGGERGERSLGAGLDDIDTAILRRILDVIEGRAVLEPFDADHLIAPVPQPLLSLGAELAAVIQAGERPPEEVERVLDDLAGTRDWADLAAALRRVLAGERDEQRLLDGLDDVDTAVVIAVLRRLDEGSPA